MSNLANFSAIMQLLARRDDAIFAQSLNFWSNTQPYEQSCNLSLKTFCANSKLFCNLATFILFATLKVFLLNQRAADPAINLIYGEEEQRWIGETIAHSPLLRCMCSISYCHRERCLEGKPNGVLRVGVSLERKDRARSSWFAYMEWWWRKWPVKNSHSHVQIREKAVIISTFAHKSWHSWWDLANSPTRKV